jgi:hypothetical protein
MHGSGFLYRFSARVLPFSRVEAVWSPAGIVPLAGAYPIVFPPFRPPAFGIAFALPAADIPAGWPENGTVHYSDRHFLRKRRTSFSKDCESSWLPIALPVSYPFWTGEDSNLQHTGPVVGQRSPGKSIQPATAAALWGHTETLTRFASRRRLSHQNLTAPFYWRSLNWQKRLVWL